MMDLAIVLMRAGGYLVAAGLGVFITGMFLGAILFWRIK